MGIFFKETISKIRKEEKESIILQKVESQNLNLTLIHRKYQKFILQTVLYTQVNRRMGLDKDQVKQHMLMALFTMDNGKMTRNMEMVNTSIQMKQNTMVNGKKI